jgi:hypothetical protein
MTITELQFARVNYTFLSDLYVNIDDHYPLCLYKNKNVSARFRAIEKHLQIITEELQTEILRKEKELL